MNILIVLSSAFALLLSLLLFHKAAGTISFLRLNTVSYALYLQVLTVGFVGPILLATHSIDYHYMVQPISNAVKFEAWVWCMYALIAMPLSMNLLNYIFKFNARTELSSYVKKPFAVAPAQMTSLISVFLLISSGLTLAYVLYYSPAIPILDVLSGEDLHQARIDRVSTKYEFEGNEYLRSFLGLILVPAVAYYFYILAFQKRTLFRISVFILQFVFAFVMLIYDTQKAPVAFFLMGFLVLHTFLTNGLSLRWFLFFFLSAVFLLLLGYKLTTDASIIDQFTRYDSAFYGRVFISSYLGFPLSLELFPDIIRAKTSLYGIPIPVLEAYGLEATNSARELMKFMNYEGVEEGSANIISGYYLGEAWASFRYAGLVIAPFLVGGIVQIIHIGLVRLPKHPLFVAFYALITVKWLISAGFSSFLTLKVILFPVAILVVLHLFMNTLYNLGNPKWAISSS